LIICVEKKGIGHHALCLFAPQERGPVGGRGAVGNRQPNVG
jgi:hypothetical protein